jgi:hypothetical protein
MHKVQIPLQFKFLENDKSQSDHDNHVFDDYFSISKLDMSINVSSNDPIKYGIYDVNA